MQRRAAYMQGLVDSLRLPPVPAPEAPAAETGDGVLLRLLELRKGRGLLARILRLLTHPKVLILHTVTTLRRCLARHVAGQMLPPDYQAVGFSKNLLQTPVLYAWNKDT